MFHRVSPFARRAASRRGVAVLVPAGLTSALLPVALYLLLHRADLQPLVAFAILGSNLLLTGGAFVLLLRDRRQSQARAIADVRLMLKDVVNNKLASIALNAELARPSERHLQRIHAQIDSISQTLEDLSPAALEAWCSHYDEHARFVPDPHEVDRVA